MTLSSVKTVSFVSALALLACEASLTATGFPSFGGEEEPEAKEAAQARAQSEPAPATEQQARAVPAPKPESAPVEKTEVAPKVPAPKQWTNVVIKDFKGLGEYDLHDPAKVRQVFEEMPLSMIRVTKKPERSELYRPGASSVDYVDPKAYREGEYTGTTKAIDGMRYTWNRCNVGHDVEYAVGGESDLCFYSFVKVKAEDPLPAGTPGIVWANGHFLTADGGVYVIYDTELVAYDGSQKLAAPFHHHHLGNASLEQLVKVKVVDASIPEELEKSYQSFIKCLHPLDKQFYEARGRVNRQNILWHTKEARIEKMDEEFIMRVDRKCKDTLEPALVALGRANDQYMAMRKELYEVFSARLKSASAAGPRPTAAQDVVNLK